MLEINGTMFSRESLINLSETERVDFIQQIFNKIKSLPEPKIVSLESSPLVKEDETVLCLQHEIAYVNSSNHESKIGYIGSKNLASCILVYIYTESNHAVIHVDNSENLDLLEILSKFNAKEKIMATLTGGDPNNLKASNSSLYIIVTALFRASAKLNATITIANQKLIEKNRFTEKCKYQFVFDTIYYKADILYRQFFNEALPDTDFKNCKADNLKSEKTTSTFLDLLLINKMLIAAEEFYDPLSDSETNSRLISKFKGLYFDKNNFIKDIKAMFSIEGFELMDKEFTNFNTYANSGLRNFVFDIQTKEIYIINKNMKTPNENIRQLLIFEPQHQTRQNKTYFKCYDEQWMKCELSKDFIKICKAINDNIKNDMGSRKAIESTFITHYVFGGNEIVKNIRLMLNQLDQKSVEQININTKSSFFTSNPKETAHDQLLAQIENMIPKEFTKHFLNFTTAIKDKKYSSALRTACTGTNPNALELTLQLIETLMRYKDILDININEQAGDQKYSALHHAARKGNKKIYDYLISQGADEKLVDKDEKTPAELILNQKDSLTLK